MADEHVHPTAIHEHEHTDMSIAAVLWFFGGLVISGIVIHLIVGGLYKYLVDHREAGEMVSPFSPPRTLPPYPRLQVSPREELRDFLNREDKVLSTYGWEDKSKGVVHIPIDRAIDLIAERGMPATPPPAAPEGMPRNPAMATRAQVTNPRGTNINPGNPNAFPVANPPASTAPPAKQKSSGGPQ